MHEKRMHAHKHKGGTHAFGVSLTPQQYAQLSRRTRIGGQPKEEVQAFQELLQSADKDADGSVSFHEFLRVVEASKQTAHLRRHLASMFASVDENADGSLSPAELCQVMFQRATPMQRREILAYVTYSGPQPDDDGPRGRVFSEETVEHCRRLFQLFDADGGGSIDVSEMEEALRSIATLLADESARPQRPGERPEGPPKVVVPPGMESQEDIKAIVAGVPTNEEGEITFEGFLMLMGPSFEPE